MPKKCYIIIPPILIHKYASADTAVKKLDCHSKSLTAYSSYNTLRSHYNALDRKDMCMKGSIHYQADRNRWVVAWYDIKAHKTRLITRYEGSYMPCTAFHMKNGMVVLNEKGRPIPDKDKCQGYELARKLRALIQGRWEQAQRGECKFRIEEFTRSGWTDTVEYYNKWIKDAIEPYRKPATVKGYKSYARNWIEPFFTKHPVQLHEIELDTLQSLLRFIVEGLKSKPAETGTDLIIEAHKKHPDLKPPELAKILQKEYDYQSSNSWIRRVIAREKSGKKSPGKSNNIGKTAMNVMSSFHAMMDYAYRAKRIPAIPPFPKKDNYNLKAKDYQYLTPAEFNKVFGKIPKEHKPIFLFMRYHYRRPGEACALHKVDYDPVNDYFKIHRAISDRQLVDSVKTNWRKSKIHRVVCDPDFSPIARRLLSENLESPYLFVNPRARKEGKRYTLESIKSTWYKACDDAGITRIWPYRATKHTACMDYVESGGTVDGLMILTDHSSRESAEAYFEITLRRKRLAQEEAKKRSEASAAAAAKEQEKPLQNLNNVVQFPNKKQ